MLIVILLFTFYIFLFFRQLSIGRPWCYPSCSISHLFWFTIVFASHVLVCKIPIGSYTIQWERLNFGWSFWYHAYSHFYQGMYDFIYLLFKLGYNYLNFMLHKLEKIQCRISRFDDKLPNVWSIKIRATHYNYVNCHCDWLYYGFFGKF